MAGQRLSLRSRMKQEIERALDRWCSEPFEWGRSDCILSIADIVRAVCDYDPAMDFRGRYSTKIGALRVTHQCRGFAKAVIRASHDFSWKVIDPSWAKTGDVGIASTPAMPCCGVIKYRSAWVSVAPQGFGFQSHPTGNVKLAWQVI